MSANQYLFSIDSQSQIVFVSKFQTPIVESGTNLIGILPGKYWNTEHDKPIIVGAHWDTVANTTG